MTPLALAHDSTLEHCQSCILCAFQRTVHMPTEPSSLATCRSLSAFRTHHRSFPDLPVAPLLAPIFWSASKGTHDTLACTFLFDGPASADASADTCNDCQNYKSVPKNRKQDFRYSPRRRPPTEPFLPPSFSTTSGINQFPTNIEEVDELTSTCHVRAFSLTTLSSSSFHFHSSSSSALCTSSA